MTAKVSEAKRRAFLRAFAQSGNMTLSAERAGMSKSWVTKARRADPDFDLACRAAKAASVGRLGAGDCNRPPKGWRQSRGADLVVRRAGRRPAQVVRSAGPWQWTPRAEARFLGLLPATRNLRLAAAQAGMGRASLEAHLRRWPDFRRRVRKALAIGRIRLGAALAAEARWPLDLFDLPEPAGPPPTIAETIRLVRRHRQG